MDPGLTITAVDHDEDYLGIEVAASTDRFAGSAWIYAGVKELSELAATITGFPRSYDDRRTHEFGNREPASREASLGLRSVVLTALDIWRSILFWRMMPVDTLRRTLLRFSD